MMDFLNSYVRLSAVALLVGLGASPAQASWTASDHYVTEIVNDNAAPYGNASHGGVSAGIYLFGENPVHAGGHTTSLATSPTKHQGIRRKSAW